MITVGDQTSGNNRGGNDTSGNESASQTQGGRDKDVAAQKFNSVWKPLIDTGAFKHITVLPGSVVLTLANNINEMPKKVIVQVSFKAPAPVNNGLGSGSGESVGSGGSGGGDGGSGESTGDASSGEGKKNSSGSGSGSGGGSSDSSGGSGGTSSSVGTAPAGGSVSPAAVPGLFPVQSVSPAEEPGRVNGISGIKTGDDAPLEYLLILLSLLMLMAASLYRKLKKC